MISVSSLDSWLGKGMTAICLNGFNNTSSSHCAHFVAHAANLHFGYTCNAHTGGANLGANMRVHEIFARCPSTSEINETSERLSGIVFVSESQNFVTRSGTTTLRNVPRKHIGFIHGGNVWHYSNPANKVVKQVMSQFLFHYRGQTNSLWYGSLPTGARMISFGQC